MEDNLQRVFSILISVIIFFFMPLYISFEKKDDISYALALKITDNFVTNVTNKGYISKKMYDNFVDELAATDNVYEIHLEHRAKRYYPVIIGYDRDNKIVKKFDPEIYEIQSEDKLKDLVTGSNVSNIVGSKLIAKYEFSYDMKEEIYNENQILEQVYSTSKPLNLVSSTEYMRLNVSSIPFVPNSYGVSSGTNTYSNVYTMSQGDEFSVVIKNTNTTLAASMFNTFTFAGSAGVSSRVYINYGSTVKEESYRYLDFSSDI